jgi:ribonuclease E
MPIALYLERASDAARAVIGERLEARVRKVDPGTGGAFVDLGAKGDGFLRLKASETYAEGAAVTVEVVAEARRNKLTRVRMATADTPSTHGAARWRASLAGGQAAKLEDRSAGDADLQSAFDDALSTAIVLAGGGRLRLERTEALIAADIDTAGRTMRGSRGDAARLLNCEAAGSLARQMLLRGWGGLCVLDCVGPIDKAAAEKIRARFAAAFRDLSDRQVKALLPSEFGLMEISADWQLTPLSERILDPSGHPAAESLALSGLRQLEAGARANRMARLSLVLPQAAFDWLRASGLGANEHLAQIYGARLTIAPGKSQTPDVTSAG